MPVVPLLMLLFVAFLTGPLVLVLLWLFYRRTRHEWTKSYAFSCLGLTGILFFNTLEILAERVLNVVDWRIYYLLMHGVFFSTVVTFLYYLRFAHQVTRTPVLGVHKASLASFSLLFYFLVLVLPIFHVSPPRVLDIPLGYTIATIYGASCQLYGTLLVLSRRNLLSSFFRPFLPTLLTIFMCLGFLSVGNDVFHFGELLGSGQFPFSPFFFLGANTIVSILVFKELVKPVVPAPLDLGLTDRETEILPLLLEGISNDQIAEKLFISPHTVKNHVSNIYRKTGVANRLELLKLVRSPSSV